MTGEEIIKVENRIKLMGVKKSHVAKNIDASPTEFSHFLSGNRNIKPEHLGYKYGESKKL